MGRNKSTEDPDKTSTKYGGWECCSRVAPRHVGGQGKGAKRHWGNTRQKTSSRDSEREGVFLDERGTAKAL